MAATVVLGLCFPTAARAQPFDVRLIPPNVLLILDTSGSMEYLNIEHHVPRCSGDPARDDPTKRTRWMQVTDALLGPIPADKYFCERFIRGMTVPYSGGFTIPNDWFIPHFLACGDRDAMGRCDPVTGRDIGYGILERYRERIRFGVGTLDSFYSTQNDVSGMWSFGGEALPWFDPSRGSVINLNVGLRRPDAAACDEANPAGPMDPNCVPGGFVGWGGDDTDMNTLNAKVRVTVTETPCYCGSAISAAFDDARRYLQTDPANLPPAGGGTDCFYGCRERYVVLITDGLPNTGEGNPYPTSGAAANAVYWSVPVFNVPVYVVGFSLCPAGTPDGNRVRAVLNQIALDGCPLADSRCPGTAYYADNTDELIAALDAILQPASADVTSRTMALTTHQVGAADPPEIVQYQYNTALRITAVNEPWEGIVERIGFVCDGSGSMIVSTDPAHYLDYGAKLNARIPGRDLRTVFDPLVAGRPTQRTTPFPAEESLETFDVTNPNLTDAQLGRPGQTATDGGAWVNSVVGHMHGRRGSTRFNRRLADVYHASAGLVGRPNLDIPIVSYYQYQTTKFNRLQMLYVATNDGVLHAFRANDDVPDISRQGEELWGYIPNALLKKIQYQIDGGHISNLDATPVIRDVRIWKDDSPATPDNDWRSVIVGGFRQGARGYYALDVTDPGAPRLLWEITDETDDSQTLETDDYANLWLTYATPMLGVSFVANDDLPGSPLGEVAVTIFPGGYRPDDPVRSTTDLYIVSTKSGRLIKKLTPTFPDEYSCAGADCADKPECCAQLVTSPVGYGALPGMLTTRVYVGDDRGRLWRADIGAQDPDNWTIELFYPRPTAPVGEPDAPYGCQTCTKMVGPPMKFPPALALNKQHELVVIYGTGDVDDVPKDEQNYIFSLTEKFEYDGGRSRYLGVAHRNWIETIEPGEKLTGVPIVFDDVVYFSTFKPVTNDLDCCAMGEGRIWGIIYNDDDPNDDGDTSDRAALDTDGLTGGPADLYRAYDNTYVAGLTVLQRPSCIDTATPPMPGLTRGSLDRYSLVAQTGGGAGSNMVPSSQVPVLQIQIPTPAISNYADSWAAVFE